MALLLREALGGSIRRARTERRRTLRDVSRSASVSLGYLSEIERGRKEPSSELLAAICEALALPLPELLDDVADTMRPGVRPVPVVDPALRSAVEEAFGEADAGATGPARAEARSGSGAGAAATAPSACATLPAPPEPADPALPRTVALPEPEGGEVPDTVEPVVGATPVRLVGRLGAAGAGGPVVRAAA